MNHGARYPFPTVPTGWFQVAYSDALHPGDVSPTTVFGTDCVLYRTDDGVARAAEAHCPHLGAHLGYGGRVEGGSLRCPFHHWRFGPDGVCDDIPYATKIPPAARLACTPVHEAGGLMYLWSGAGAPDAPPPAPPAEAAGWATARHHRRIRTHVQEVGENIVDSAHFAAVHLTAAMPETRVETEGPVLRSFSTLRQSTPRGVLATRIDAVGYGLGIWHLWFRGIVDTLVIGCPTPVDDEHIDFRLTFHVPPGTESGVGGAMIDEIMFQLDQDIPIWEHKVYRERPLLCAGDGPIAALRKWSRQFYPAG